MLLIASLSMIDDTRALSLDKETSVNDSSDDESKIHTHEKQVCVSNQFGNQVVVVRQQKY